MTDAIMAPGFDDLPTAKDILHVDVTRLKSCQNILNNRPEGRGRGLASNCEPMLEQRTAKLTRNILKLITPFHCIQSKITRPNVLTFLLLQTCTGIESMGKLL